MRHLWGYLNLFPIICLILKKIKIFFNIIAKKKFELIYKDWSKLFVRYTPLRNPQVGLHDVYNLIEVISSWTEQKLRSILKCFVDNCLLVVLFFIWPLYCLSFSSFLLTIVLSVLLFFSFDHCIVCPSLLFFWPLYCLTFSSSISGF